MPTLIKGKPGMNISGADVKARQLKEIKRDII